MPRSASSCLRCRSSRASRCSSEPRSELAVQPSREYRHRAAISVVGRVDDELVVGGEGETLVQRVGVIGFEDALAAVVERAIADENTEAAGGQEVAIILRDGIDGATDADHVIGPAPFRALDRKTAGQAAVNVGEGQRLGLAVIPAPTPEQTDIPGD